MCKYIKLDYVLSSAKNEISRDFELVTSTEYNYILEFSYRSDNIIYSLDTRLSNYNYDVVDDFWSFNYEHLQDYLNEINIKEYFTVTHYKGKKFFIVENYFQVDAYNTDYFTYKCYDNKEKREVLRKLINALESELLNIEIKSLVYNELNIGGYQDRYYTEEYYTKLNFNNDLLSKLYNDDLVECAYDILDNINYKNCFLNDTFDNCLYTEVNKSYKKLLHSFYLNKLESNKKFNYILNYNLALSC